MTLSPGGTLILAAPKKHGDGFAPALILAQVRIADLLETSDVPDVLAISAGSLDKPLQDLVHRARKHVVSIVFSDGTVVLLDPNLKIKWKSKIPLILERAELKDVSVLVTPHGSNSKAGGMVIISAREQSASLHEDEDYDTDIVARQEDEEKHEHGRRKEETLSEVDSDPRTTRHVSYFALDGTSGDTVWKHTPEDFHKDPLRLHEFGVKTLYSDRLSAEIQDGVHYGEHSCRDYRESVLASLPHSWFDESDSMIRLAHFHKHKKHHGPQRHNLATRYEKNKAKVNAPPAVHHQWKRETLDNSRRHKPEPPNVLVSHVEDGMEVIHLYSGRPVCRLSLEKKVLHVDINGDGVPDHVHVSGGIPRGQQLETDVARHQLGHEKIGSCMTRVTSGIPASLNLFNGTICSSAVTGRPSHGILDVAPPVALPVPNRKGHYAGRSLHQKMNLFFFNSRGEVTSYDHRGDRLYTIQTGIQWKQRHPNVDPEMWDDESFEGEDSEYDGDPASVPTFESFAFRPNAIPSGILASGTHMATIITEHGKELWTCELPEPPVQQIAQVDFNMDGFVDVILVTDKGLYGWAQIRSPGGMSISALAGGLIVVMLVILITQQQFVAYDGDTRYKGRSTDRVD